MPIAALNDAERAVAAALAHGRAVDLRTGDPAGDDPAVAASWDAGRTVRGEVLAGLLLGGFDEPADQPRLILAGARITGALNLAFAELPFPVTFQGCAFDAAPDLYHARTRFLSFSGSLLPGLTASNVQVEGNLWLAGSHVTGELRLPGGRIRLTSAQVGSRLCLDGATLAAPGEVALKCWRLEARELALRTAAPVDGVVELRYARIGVLRDDPAGRPRAMRMDGLSYEVLDPMLPAARRLRWLRADPDGYLPGAYEQLAAMYRRLGGDADARETLLAGQRQRRATLPWYARFWGHLQDATVGYGFRPLRAAAWLAALLAAGTVVFGLDVPPPLKPGEAPPFHALVYTLDLLLPIIDLGQEKAYNPQGGAQWLAWGLIMAGWVLATTIAAGLTRSLRRT
ncbi:hypothetical protein [Nonomuraea sp. NPDC049624]|uniref:hypothetical protein n=1 Tax=Nonomuraea sp. NPDC049624 TaxID=3154354 RepID=UPI00344AFC8C